MNSLRSLRAITQGLFLLACSASASADAFMLDQGGSPSLAPGHSYASAFDIRLLYDASTQRLDNATLTLNFVGGSDKVRNGDVVDTITGTAVDDTGATWHSQDHTTPYLDALDRAAVMMGRAGGQAGMADDAAALYTDSIVNSSVALYTPGHESCAIFVGCTWVPGQLVGYNRNVDSLSGYKGAFSFSANLDSDSLAALRSTDLLRYGFTVSGGAVQLASATLSFNTSPVPEPTSLTLLLLGLLGGGVAVRKR